MSDGTTQAYVSTLTGGLVLDIVIICLVMGVLL